MKIRWTASSIRLRITPSELQALNQDEIVREGLRVGSGEWAAHIVPGSAATNFGLMDGALEVNLSVHDLDRLNDSKMSGVYFDPTPEQPVRFYIEKDLACEHPRAAEAKEPQTETFAAPPAS